MKKTLVIVASLVGLIFLYVSYAYATHSAGLLPTFYPGYLVGSPIVHIKHAIATFLLGVACFIFAWFQSGSKN